jgi:hypothetical protein
MTSKSERHHFCVATKAEEYELAHVQIENGPHDSVMGTRPGLQDRGVSALRKWPAAYSGAALSPCELDSFEASEAITITAAISAITMVQIALISGFTPSRTSE